MSDMRVLYLNVAEMVDRRVEVVARLKTLEESAAPLISFLQNATLVQELRPDKQYNIQMLSERFQVGPDPLSRHSPLHLNELSVLFVPSWR
jgi:eIF3 subunit 6 N terminal domain